MSIKIVFFDCDGTLTKVKSSWEFLHRRLGLWDNRADEYQRLFRDGKISYDEFCRRDALLWGGLPVQKVAETIAEIPYNHGCREAVSLIKGLGIITVIVSSGLSILVEKVQKKVGADMAFSNELVAQEGVLTGEVRIQVEHNQKGRLIKKVLASAGLTQENACAVGDGEGDLGMFEEVGLPVGFHPCTKILPFVKHTICSGSLLPLVEVVRNHH